MLGIDFGYMYNLAVSERINPRSRPYRLDVDDTVIGDNE